MEKQYALITGVGKQTGIGFETARQLGSLGYHVIITSRDLERVQQLGSILTGEGLEVTTILLDVLDEDSVMMAAEQVGAAFGKLDVLINNATLFPDNFDLISVDVAAARNIFDSNFFGAWRTIKYFAPWLMKSTNGRIVNVSSGSGSFAAETYNLLNPWKDVISVYSLSKLALNGLTLKAAADLREYGILVNAATPGVTATYDVLAGLDGRPVEQGANSIVLAATLPKEGPTGKFLKDGQIISW